MGFLSFIKAYIRSRAGDQMHDSRHYGLNRDRNDNTCYGHSGNNAEDRGNAGQREYKRSRW